MSSPAHPQIADPKEWDFSRILDGEAEICFYYEEAREALAMGICEPLPPLLRDHWRQTNMIAGWLSYFGVHIFAANFPEIAWQNQPRSEVKRLLDLLAPRQEGLYLVVEDYFDCKIFNERPRVEQPDPEDREAERPYDPKFVFHSTADHHTYAVIRMNWRDSKQSIKRQFNRLLDQVPCKGLNGGRNSFRDKLHGLTALRLVRLCGTPEKALTLIEKRIPHRLFADERSLRRAARRARKELVARWNGKNTK